MDDIDKTCELLWKAKVFREISIRLDRGEMLRRTGLSGRKRQVAPSLLFEFDSIVREVESEVLVRPAAVTRVLKILEIAPDHIVTSGGGTLTGTILQHKAPNATHIGVAICTIGGALEERVSKYREKDLLRCLILDGIGSVAADSLMQEVGKLFSLVAGSLNATASSPLPFGTAGLPLTNLDWIFKLLPVSEIGVHITSSFFMVPQKTCAFVVGIGPAMPTWSREGACRQCSLHATCRYKVQVRTKQRPCPTLKL